MGIKRWGVSERDRLQSIAPAVDFFSGTLITSRWLKVRRSTIIPDGPDLVVAAEIPIGVKNPDFEVTGRRTDEPTRNHAPAVGWNRGVCSRVGPGAAARAA